MEQVTVRTKKELIAAVKAVQPGLPVVITYLPTGTRYKFDHPFYEKPWLLDRHLKRVARNIQGTPNEAFPEVV